MAVGVFAGFPVSDYRSAVKWYELLLGAPASFYPNDVEAKASGPELSDPPSTLGESLQASCAAAVTGCGKMANTSSDS